MQLDQEQTEKLARLWQFCRNQSALWVREHEPDSEPLAVRYIRPSMGGIRAEVVDSAGRLWRPLSRELHPDLSDPVTRDGLPRTARAALKEDSLCCANDRSGWWVRYLAKTHPYAPEVIAYGKTESDAWLTAILAAPEGK